MKTPWCPAPLILLWPNCSLLCLFGCRSAVRNLSYWQRVSFCCLTSTEASRPITGTGKSGERGTEEWNLQTGANPEDRGCRGPPPEQQDVKAASVRHCAATTAPRNCCPNCYAEQSHKDNVRSSAVGKQLKQKKSNSLAEHHLPDLDLFWASFFVRVKLTSLLLISPGLTTGCKSAIWRSF